MVNRSDIYQIGELYLKAVLQFASASTDRMQFLHLHALTSRMVQKFSFFTTQSREINKSTNSEKSLFLLRFFFSLSLWKKLKYIFLKYLSMAKQFFIPHFCSAATTWERNFGQYLLSSPLQFPNRKKLDSIQFVIV